MVDPVPAHLHSVTPSLVVTPCAEAIDFYAKAFGATEIGPRMTGPDGKVGHAELRIGDSVIFVADEWPDGPVRSPASLGGSSAALMIYVDDVDAAWQRAIDAGAEVVFPLEVQFYGDKGGRVRDPFGHTWGLGQHLEDVDDAEMAQRMASFYDDVDAATQVPEGFGPIDPARLDAVIFDLDGVITDTAAVHTTAWRRLFDDFLSERPAATGEDHSRFTDDDYLRHVDGKPRIDGIADFLAARGISLPRGGPDDDPAQPTLGGLANRKNEYFQAALDRDGVRVFPSTVELVRRLQAAGLGTAVFSSSRNCRMVLERAGLGDLFEVRVDGEVAAELGLPGKPDPATLVEAARRLDTTPDRCGVVEDATSGVEAGRAGGFALVIGIARDGRPDRLREAGADVVVGDLAELARVRA